MVKSNGLDSSIWIEILQEFVEQYIVVLLLILGEEEVVVVVVVVEALRIS